KAHAAQIKDSIVLVDSKSMGTENGDQFDQVLEAIALLPGEGARALLLAEGALNDVPSMFGLTCCTGALVSLPVGNVGLEDSLLLKRLIERGPVGAEFNLTKH